MTFTLVTTFLARLYQRTNTGKMNSFVKNVYIHLQLIVPLLTYLN